MDGRNIFGKSYLYLVVLIAVIIVLVAIVFSMEQSNKSSVNTQENISVYYSNGNFDKAVEVDNITLPIDSLQKAYSLYEQASIDPTNSYTYNFTEQGNYWGFQNELICPPESVPHLPCGGGCMGRINKANGNIENL